MTLRDISHDAQIAEDRALLVRAMAGLTPTERDRICALIHAEGQDAVTAALAQMREEPHLANLDKNAIVAALLLNGLTHAQVEAVIPAAYLKGIMDLRGAGVLVQQGMKVEISDAEISAALQAAGVPDAAIKDILSRRSAAGAAGQGVSGVSDAIISWFSENQEELLGAGITVASILLTRGKGAALKEKAVRMLGR
jgi:hypothetical protein